MHHPAPLLQQARTAARERPLLLWLLALVLLLKAAVPLLAASAARERGIAVAEICSVYGVRTVTLDDRAPTAPATQAHAGGEHCTLTPLLSPAPLATPALAAVLLHAPLMSRAAPLPPPPAPPDASLAWLAARTHAPPPGFIA